MLTFETKCYENDWEFILKGSYLEKMIERCNYPFAKKVVLINNVKDIKKAGRYAERKIKKGIIDEYYLVEDHAKKALDFFNIEMDSFRGGYLYSISELVGILLCETEYLVHFSSDSFPDNSRSRWIPEAMDIFRERKDILVANPTWDFNFLQAKEESVGTIGNFYLGQGFSDQCYMVRIKDFRKQIYNESHPASARYPAYGGELFEKRVDSYMRNHDFLRITSKQSCYMHKNFTKNRVERFKRRMKIFFHPNKYN
jgi:hypothetical protein